MPDKSMLQGNDEAPHAEAARVRARRLELVSRWKLSGWLWVGSCLVPLGLLAGLLVVLMRCPEVFAKPPAFGFHLPSEDAIPKPKPCAKIDETDPTWRFRFAATGTEYGAGIPYWIFRAMPALFDDVFAGQGYERFGFTSEDGEYYERTPVPRGMTLSDTSVRLPFFKFSVKLKRVALNCAACHRGAYLKDGKRILVDGMPNHSADLQGFKRFFVSALRDPRFAPGPVIEEINRLLELQGSQRLLPSEEVLYAGIVEVMRKRNENDVTSWMDSRPDNGVGRIDPFNAVKFEVLQVPDDNTVATIDFPSVWNQGPAIRPWHHCDGNTDDSSARNYGSVIGVGGAALSVDKLGVSDVGVWLDGLPPPRYPFESPAPAEVEQGIRVFSQRCAGCHGLYDREKNTVTQVEEGSRYMQRVDVETDAERWKAFPPAAARVLNDWGERRGLWSKRAFRGSDPAAEHGYLCGPLDGVWARAPYLHNGSVPNIAELLKPPEARVESFYRGSRRYDEQNMGWVSTETEEDGRALFKYETRKSDKTPVPGNGNFGHPFSVDEAERPFLIAYLKTL